MTGPAASGTQPAKKSRAALWAVIASLAALLVVAVVVVVVAFVVVSSDASKARDLMNSSDALIDSASSSGDAVGEDLQSLLEDLANGNIETVGDFESGADAIRADLEEIRSDLEKAREGYEEILELEGVEEYKTYSKTVLELIDVFLEHAQLMDDYLDYLSGELAREAAGEFVDSDEVAQVTAAFVEGATEFNNTENELKEKAKEIKKENDL